MTSQSIPIINQYVALIRLGSLDKSLAFVEEITEKIIADLDLKVVKKIIHTFSPTGSTLAYILSESHLLIHTWPELGVIHIDLVICTNRTKKEFEKSIKSAFSKFEIDSIQIKSVNFD